MCVMLIWPSFLMWYLIECLLVIVAVVLSKKWVNRLNSGFSASEGGIHGLLLSSMWYRVTSFFDEWDLSCEYEDISKIVKRLKNTFIISKCSIYRTGFWLWNQCPCLCFVLSVQKELAWVTKKLYREKTYGFYLPHLVGRNSEKKSWAQGKDNTY